MHLLGGTLYQTGHNSLLSEQVLSEESVKRWYSWAGGSAKACLNLNGKDPHGLAAWKREVQCVLAKVSPRDLMVRILF